MSKLLTYRENLNLTQKELSEKSGLSIRTIQRIESGTEPKGHTLKVLLNTLNITKEEFLGEPKPNMNKNIIKWINFSSLMFIIPLANILLPLLIMKKKKQVNSITKQIISIQILWTLLTIVFVGISPFFVRWFGTSRQLTLILLVISILINLYIIFRNAIEIENKDRLYIKLKSSII
ncbi:helix-turn-helix transcriptional regulator [Gramella jeungdoensis]|uniref:Helix-turn-helix transcriptional regulator n=1 Tax=Gramella jeungdoensis TaxID=708091 RepID=A0ABT0YYK4_9FLAO|nr:helix-turn-helix transcriptional regulator [Gramella jeungdoensis]MCM8568547.1 helix-turn-helix transcriptional regulator [Gramella jeungdoensis]